MAFELIADLIMSMITVFAVIGTSAFLLVLRDISKQNDHWGI